MFKAKRHYFLVENINKGYECSKYIFFRGHINFVVTS